LTYTVAAVDEAITLLLLVAAQPGLGVTEIAKRTGNTKGRAFRLLTTLEQRGLVSRQGASAAYYLDYQALHLGAAAHGQIDLVRLAEEPLARLGALCNETVAVRVRDGLETVCVARWESTQPLRVQNALRRPLYAGASSKVLLAFAPQEVLDAVLASDRLRITATTPVERDALLGELEKVRQQDWAISVAERTAETTGIGVPIRNAGGAVIAALTISAPSSRMTDERLDAYLRQLRAEAQTISTGLGFVPRS